MAFSAARAGTDLRLLRAALFAAVCTTLSALGHGVASCAPVPLWTVGVAFPAVLAVAVPLAGRERSLPGIAAGLAAGQLVLHSLFGLGQHSAAAPRPGGPPVASEGTLIALAARLACNDGPGRPTAAEARRILAAAGVDTTAYTAGPAGHADHFGHAAATAAAHPPSLLEAALPSPAMLLGHLAAALVLGLLLRRGEAALFRLARLSARGLAEGAPVRSLRAALALVRALHTGLPGAPGTRGPVLRPYGRDDAAPPGVPVLEHSVVRRGPPPLVRAA